MLRTDRKKAYLFPPDRTRQKKKKKKFRAPCFCFRFERSPFSACLQRKVPWKTFAKDSIQPQVPLRLPCYDFTPVADPTVVACPLAVSEAPSGRTNSHGVTGGVYKAWERIHRGMLIRDY